MKKSKTYVKICENVQAQKQVSFRVLKKLLESYEFVFIRSKGSHHRYTGTIGSEVIMASIPNQKSLKRIYVVEACKFIKRKIEYGRTEDNGDSSTR